MLAQKASDPPAMTLSALIGLHMGECAPDASTIIPNPPGKTPAATGTQHEVSIIKILF
jgi:hypothetical protein